MRSPILWGKGEEDDNAAVMLEGSTTGPPWRPQYREEGGGEHHQPGEVEP